MMIHLDADEAMFIEQLTLDEARTVLEREQAVLAAVPSASHSRVLQLIGELEDQIEWLEAAQAAQAARDAADEHAETLLAEMVLLAHCDTDTINGAA